MALTYDFDIFEVIAGSAPKDRDDDFRMQADSKTDLALTRIALFRDPRTADALRCAPDALRSFFLASGFGLSTYSSGAPHGRYPAKDEEARLEVIHRLTENAETHSLPPLQGYSEGGDIFRLGEFLAELSCAEPIEDMQGFSHRFEIVETALDADHIDPATIEGDAVQAATFYGFPPIFDTDPIPHHAVETLDEAAPRRKFWQNRLFLMGTAAAIAVLAVVVQLTSGQSMPAFASL